MSQRTRDAVAAVTGAAAFVAVWPWSTSPFHDIKSGVLAAGLAASLPAVAPGAGARALVTPGAAALWLVAVVVAPGSPWPALLPPALALAWSLGGLSPGSARGPVAGAALMASVVLLQAVGLDPLAGFGPHASGRLALYGTAGNPDFVASALTAALPLVVLVHRAGGRWSRGAAALILLALALTRSFATVAALLAGGLLVLFSVPLRWRLGGALTLLAVAAPLLSRSPSRALGGRLYLHEVAAPHLADAPLRGLGHGAVEDLWPVWELELWKSRCGLDPGCVRAHPQAPFAGLQDHVHDDWLELALTLGLPGAVVVLVLVVGTLGAALRRRDVVGTACAASLAMLAVRAAVDFPLFRPLDGYLLAVVCGLVRGSPSVGLASIGPGGRTHARVGEERGGDVERAGRGAARSAGQGSRGRERHQDVVVEAHQGTRQQLVDARVGSQPCAAVRGGNTPSDGAHHPVAAPHVVDTRVDGRPAATGVEARPTGTEPSVGWQDVVHVERYAGIDGAGIGPSRVGPRVHATVGPDPRVGAGIGTGVDTRIDGR